MLKILKPGRRAVENTKQKVDSLCSEITCCITKGSLQSQYNSHQNSNDILHKNGKNISKFIWK